VCRHHSALSVVTSHTPEADEEIVFKDIQNEIKIEKNEL